MQLGLLAEVLTAGMEENNFKMIIIYCGPKLHIYLAG